MEQGQAPHSDWERGKGKERAVRDRASLLEEDPYSVQALRIHTTSHHPASSAVGSAYVRGRHLCQFNHQKLKVSST